MQNKLSVPQHFVCADSDGMYQPPDARSGRKEAAENKEDSQPQWLSPELAMGGGV